MKLTAARYFNFISDNPANIIIPNSSGNGEAITNPERAYNKYTLILLGKCKIVCLIKNLNCFVFFNLLNSSMNENRIILKISRSASRAPRPPTIAAKKIFSGLDIIKNPTAKGVVKPKVKSMPNKK